MKKIVIFIFMGIICLTLCIKGADCYAYAALPSDDSIASSIEDIEDELTQSSTSIDDELDALYLSFQSAGVSTDCLNNLSDVASSYDLYASGQARAVYYPSAYIAAVLSYFSFCGYYLSAELLNFAFMNVNESYVYTPLFKDVILKTAEYERITLDDSTEGTAEFPFEGTVFDEDAYMALRTAHYSKNGTNVLITDTYDFAANNSDDNWILRNAQNIMYAYQYAHIIVPFDIEISLNHYHSYTYEDMDYYYHRAVCMCGYSKLENHVWVSERRPGVRSIELCSIPYYECSKCGRTELIIYEN